MSDKLRKVQEEILKQNHSEIETRNNNGSMEEIWAQIQVLRNEMNAAKKQASDEAAKPFLEKIAELEADYAIMLKFSV